MAEPQVIPARHAVATFVPKGQTIKIINTFGNQVIDTWAFALPAPETKKDDAETKEVEDETRRQLDKAAKEDPKDPKEPQPKEAADLPSQEEAEKATRVDMKNDGKPDQAQQKSGWSSYVPSVPSLGLTSSKKETPAKPAAKREGETEQQKNSRTWSSYIPSGKAFGSYIPKSATDTVSSFAKDHKRDPNKPYWQQLRDFSKTPVGAAGIAAVTGSGYTGSFAAGYQAWNASQAGDVEASSYLSMAHTRALTFHLSPQVDDTLVSNLREPFLTLIEDTSPGNHDTLLAACDPMRYGEEDAEHGSCAENLVLALKELNERAGLKGIKAIGADVAINSVPAPLNLFMNVNWDDKGEGEVRRAKGKKGDYVKFRAEKDLVMVMSACPEDWGVINGGTPSDGKFVVEGEQVDEALKRATPQRKRPPPRKLSSQQGTSQANIKNGPTPAPVARKTAVTKAAPAKAAPPKTPASAPAKKPESNNAAATTTAAPRKKPVPKPIAPQKEAAPETNNTNTNGDGDGAPVQKKKPRKLAPKAS